MKKVLLGTTVLAATAMVGAGAASAAEKIKLGVGGYYFQAFAVGDGTVEDATGATVAEHQATAQRQEGEIHFKGETTLDNGLTVGVNVQLEAYTTGDQVDEHYAYLEGGWGQIIIGAENDAAYKMRNFIPGAITAHGVDSPTFSYTTGIPTGAARTNASLTRVSDANKVSYFTPRFGGFQLGVSYTPDAGGDISTGGTGGGGALVEDNGLEDVFSVGANFSNSFGGFDVLVTGGFLTGSASGGADDPEDYGFGAEIGFGGFTLGGAYSAVDDAAGEDITTWGAGLTYGTGPWTVGAAYLQSEDDGSGELRTIEGGGTYNLGPGVNVAAGVTYFEGEDATGEGDSIFGHVTLGLSF